MTTVVTTTTRFWESDDSVESIIDHYRGEYAIWSSRNLTPAKQQTSVQVKKINKKTSSISRTNVLAVPKRNLKTELANDVSKVKKSALLYEITDRTNRLARPRTTAISNENSTVGKYLSSRVSLPTNSHVSSKYVSERFSELSRPKTIYNPPIRTLGYIAPSALRAVATKRIVELATPRKKPSEEPREERSSKRKNNRYGFVETPCSSRINYLARPKKFVRRKEAQKNYLKRSIPSQILHPPPWYY